MSDEKKNSYVKEGGFREIKKSKPTTKTKEVPAKPVQLIPEARDGYLKTEKNLDTSLFIIVSGGEKREKGYFNILKSDLNTYFPRIDIRFFSKKKQGLDPKQMLEKAKDVQSGLHEIAKSDKFYLVSDVDHFRDKLLAIIPECEQLNFRLIISNYCFEVWLYYSCFDCKPTDFVKPSQLDQCSSVCKNYVHNKYGKGITSGRAFLYIEEAIVNSEKNYTEDEDGIPSEFSSQMHILAKEIHPLIKEELKEYIKKAQEKAEMHKNSKPKDAEIL